MGTNKNSVIEVEGVSKTFGAVEAVKKVSFSVLEGELFGFLGPNGAGKTTTINMLTGLARSDSGKIRIAGTDISKKQKAAQHLIGVVPDESNLYPELSGYENLCFCGALYGMKKKDREHRVQELLHLFGLAEASNRKFSAYSKGMKRKLTIAAGIIHYPPILFLDEPTSGIDVAGARQIRKLIYELHQNNITIFLTTHYIEEAERLCGRIAFIVAGKIVKSDTLHNLMENTKNKHVIQFEVADNQVSNDCHALARLVEKISEAFPGFACNISGKKTLRIESYDEIRIGPVVRLIEECGFSVYEARKIGLSLEDVFVQITGIETENMQGMQNNTQHNMQTQQ